MSAEVVRPGGERVGISWREHPGEGDVGSVGVGWRRPVKGELALTGGDGRLGGEREGLRGGRGRKEDLGSVPSKF